MFNYITLQKALAELEKNKEQFEAVHCKTHCVVLAGPGSGKTKTLTTAIARTLKEEVIAPRAIACITYNNECVRELKERLAKLGVKENNGWLSSRWNLTYSAGWEKICRAVNSV